MVSQLKAFAQRLRDDYWYPFVLGVVLVLIGGALGSIRPHTWEDWFVFVVGTWLFGSVILGLFRIEQRRER